MTEPAWWSPLLTVWVDRVDAHWRALGIADDLRIRLRRDLVADLGRALLSGAAADELVEADPRRFAEDVATAEGVEHATAAAWPHPVTRVDRLRLTLIALAGAFAGGLLSLVTVYPIGSRIIDESHGGYAMEGEMAMAMHVVAAVLAATCGGLAVRWHFRRQSDPERLGFAAGAGLLVSGAVAAVLTVAFARTTDYSTRTPVVFTELVLVVLVCACGLLGTARLLRLNRSG